MSATKTNRIQRLDHVVPETTRDYYQFVMVTLADESLECSCGFRENGREDEEGDEGETMKIKCQKCEEVRRILVNAQWYLDLSPEAEFDRRNVESLVKKLLDIARSS